MKSKPIIFLLLSFVLISSHAESKSTQKTRIVVATMQTPVHKLYYSGTVEPIQTVPVVSPVEGNIVSMNFAYGQRIADKQLLFVMSSSTLAENYRKAINDYLQKKLNYYTQQQNFAGMKSLSDAGAISKNDYTTSKSQFDNAKLDFLQSQYALETVLQTANVDPKKIEMLTISDTDEVNKLLQRRFRHIEIIAPAAGIALFPAKDSSSSSGGASGAKLTVGATAKEDQLLLSIGDMSGLSADFNVSEVDIYRIQNNLPVVVTGSSFPGRVLHGYVSAVSAQEDDSSGSSGGLSMYAVSVKIPNVDPKTMERIRVGMTAKFEIDIPATPKIMLPLEAVFEKQGKSLVTMMDEHGKPKEVPVITGRTTMTDVAIESGLKPGDKVIVND